MSALARSRPIALALTSVPGWGHVYWGREVRGLGIFTLFAVTGFVLFNALYIYIGSARSFLITTSLVLLSGTVLWAWIDILRATGSKRVREVAERRSAALRDGMLAYVGGDFQGAIERFESCVRADPSDFEALFRLGIVHARAGDLRQARLWLRRARKHDWDEKWRWEIDRELDSIRATGDKPAAEPPREAREKLGAQKQEA